MADDRCDLLCLDLPRAEALRRAAPDTTELDAAAASARALADPTRLRLAVALRAGIAASSIALIGFGLDSAIEGFASVIIIWRFTGRRVFSLAAEERAQKLVAIQFFLLAPYVGVESLRALVGGERPDESLVGILLAIGSPVFMPMLGMAKQRLPHRPGS